jgi:thiamine biosynthesis lipoprotein
MYIFWILVLTLFEADIFSQQTSSFVAWNRVSAKTFALKDQIYTDNSRHSCIRPVTINHTRPPLQRYEFSHPQMGTVFHLVFYAEQDSVAAAAVAARIFGRVDTLNAIFSDYLPESELNRLSDRAGNPEPTPVSVELEDILRRACRYSKATDGAFDVTVGALTRLWRRAFHLQELPDPARITAARETVDWRDIRFPGPGYVRLTRRGTRLDLGGIAAGYAADECLRLLRAAGIHRALVDAGGDIALGDAPPGAAGWRIEKPTLDPNVPETLFLTNCGITTSGATYKYLEVNGVRYSHIVDPKTGMGLTHRVLVTVQAPDATTADAWATAISVGGATGWRKWKKRCRKVKAWLTETGL